MTSGVGPGAVRSLLEDGDAQVDQQLVGVRVDGVEDGTSHAASGQHAVGVADHRVEVIGVDLVAVLVLAAFGLPPVPPHQVTADDDASVVVLKALGAVDAADLTKAGRIGGP